MGSHGALHALISGNKPQIVSSKKKRKKKDPLAPINHIYEVLMMVVVSQFNGTSTPKGSYSAKAGDNDCNVNSSR